MVEAEELWHHDISPNKHAILERKLIKSLVELKLQPHTHQVELPGRESTGDKNLGATEIFWIEANPEQIKATEALWEVLQEDITKVVGAGTDDLAELAKIVNLNPLNDFAGANLLACDLRNGDFTGADFTKANLRGADLTDADFTGASLVGAKLAGADLTGAMLSDANLTGADLHLSSLALASLSGAKLEGANLHQANLSNANLSDADLTDADLTGADLHQAGLVLTNLSGAKLAGAKVAAARFKSPMGMTDAIVRDLQQLGAIFEEL
ncbi:MAG TPA: pentapeptide repeat-containing protein [Oscillatoriaceae cyanobacterium M33_DOE_052]|uniref:Pentapeptide repeat-containing protein n=1 Tax=Planktothricoides sp. SpSt-374 TaxID=2282167 RepID=A0A7C3VEA5_9CYAN|nr:pentapeptide repeat-containing protein [Oscillatoriaceae cyanobacterium M33_DOE_052]